MHATLSFNGMLNVYPDLFSGLQMLLITFSLFIHPAESIKPENHAASVVDLLGADVTILDQICQRHGSGL